MPTIKDAPQPTEHQLILRQQMTDDFALLRELGYAPAEIFDVMGRPDIKRTEQFYRQHIMDQSKGLLPMISHRKVPSDQSEQIQRLYHRYNIRASLANLVTAWFMAGKMQYPEYAVVARGLVYDGVLELEGEKEADKLLDVVDKNEDRDDFYIMFPWIVNSAMDNQIFEKDPGTGLTLTQEKTFATLNELLSSKFLDTRKAIIMGRYRRSDPVFTDYFAAGREIREDEELSQLAGVQKDDSTMVGWFKMDAYLSELQNSSS